MSKKPLSADTPAPAEAPALPILTPELATILLLARAKAIGATIVGGDLNVGGSTYRARVDGDVIQLVQEISVTALSLVRDELRDADRALTQNTSRLKLAEANAAAGWEDAEDEVKELTASVATLTDRVAELREKVNTSLGETVVEYPIHDGFAFEVRA